MGNSGQRLTPDTQHISAMNKSFGLKLEVAKHLPLAYLQTKNELTTLSHCDAGHQWRSQSKCDARAQHNSMHRYILDSVSCMI